MAKSFKPRVFTANDLIEGDAVYLGHTGWVRDVREAAVAHTPEEATGLGDRAAAGERDNLVVGVYDLEVRLESGHPWPVLRREQIKAERRTTFATPAETELSRAA